MTLPNQKKNPNIPPTAGNAAPEPQPVTRPTRRVSVAIDNVSFAARSAVHRAPGLESRGV